MSTADETQTKYIFVTGGVVSSLGKGIAAASLGRLLVERGLSVTMQKFDPYINVDPGTMSPTVPPISMITTSWSGADRRMACLISSVICGITRTVEPR